MDEEHKEFSMLVLQAVYRNPSGWHEVRKTKLDIEGQNVRLDHYAHDNGFNLFGALKSLENKGLIEQRQNGKYRITLEGQMELGGLL